jgi:Tol biopolymer transport system component
VNLGPKVNSPSDDFIPSIAADGLTLFFVSVRPGGYGGRDIWVTTRATTSDPWTEPVNPGPPINTSAWDQNATISADGSTLYFSSMRPGGYGGLDIWQVPISPLPPYAQENGDSASAATSDTSEHGKEVVSQDKEQLYSHEVRPTKKQPVSVVLTSR